MQASKVPAGKQNHDGRPTWKRFTLGTWRFINIRPQITAEEATTDKTGKATTEEATAEEATKDKTRLKKHLLFYSRLTFFIMSNLPVCQLFLNSAVVAQWTCPLFTHSDTAALIYQVWKQFRLVKRSQTTHLLLIIG